LQLTRNRRAIAVDDRRLEDRVADNRHKWEITESESLLIGRNFGVGTDVQTGPNGNLFVVSLAMGRCTRFFACVGIGTMTMTTMTMTTMTTTTTMMTTTTTTIEAWLGRAYVKR
jgi:hypothetical protein